ncbi:MAG: TrmH family RNA methyltransferase, partial [Flavobacteriales bacterium]
MLSKNEVKHIRSLHQKKYRKKEKKFLVEGKKSLDELIKSELNIHAVYYTKESEKKHGIPEEVESISYLVDKKEMEKISQLQTPPGELAIVSMPVNIMEFSVTGGQCILLDQIQDPGNAGTIIRSADHFGVRDIVFSP